jgi:hypothetical protein
MLQASASDAAGGSDSAAGAGGGAAIRVKGGDIGGGRRFHRWEAELQGGHVVAAR